ncbi:Growth arrest-specific protein 8 [Cinara cedri]|uniref:Dynein regulatory complex subunit 4 n=1 Tax=Cinara cedri TaxID=506608 RepID=A0A5E4NEP9_9HEMI|nr:Growth arrest-specific protein 8 [Cinara cedri]
MDDLTSFLMFLNLSVKTSLITTKSGPSYLINRLVNKAPKKKSKGGKGGRTSAGIVDGVSMAEMSRDQLEGFAARMKKELEREREERNFFQLERDKVLTFWEITRHELEENRASLRNKDREIEDIEEKHQDEIKVYKQKLKLLMYEQHVHLSEVQAENMVSLKIANDEHIKEEDDLVKENDALKQEIVEINLRHIEEINNLRLEHARVMRQLKDRFIMDCQAIEGKYQKRMEDLRNRMDLKNKVEVAETEARKNKRIAEIIEDHNNAFNNLKEHYNDITVNNLTLIGSLKEKLLELKEDQQRAEMGLKEVTKENESLRGPLNEARNTVEELTQKMANYIKDKQRLTVLTKRLKHSIEKYKELQVNYDELKMISEKMQTDLDNTNDEYTEKLMRLQMEHGKKLLTVEHRLKRSRDVVEEKEAQIARLTAATSMDTSIAMAMNVKTEALLAKKNKQIEQIWNDLTTVTKKYNELSENFKCTLQSHGIQYEHEIFELVTAKKDEYFENV